ncbi:MAG TPA: prepilin-type N-terminal cleavage/methylation domain-containing protein [Phycisphaerae bacterium]|nr:prepilin-type N-terminal cleavage/methylation domain-containing protein [Phycisphaerae bacterium]
MSAFRQKSSAFTLIELLIVVAIIAAVISVIMPALTAAKVQSWKMQCQSHLFEIARYDSMYAQEDPGDIIGPIHAKAPDFILEGYAQYGGGPGDMEFQKWGDPFDPRTRPFNAMMYGADNITPYTEAGDRRYFMTYQCPGDDFGWQDWPNMTLQRLETERPYFFGNGTAYRMNNLSDFQAVPAVSQGPAGGGTGGGMPDSPHSIGIYGRPGTRVPDSAKVVNFMEARAFQTLWTNDVWGDSSYLGELTGCHRKLGFFDLAYVDGHVDYADMGKGTFFPRQAKYDNHDVRGTWGQMDCFPDEPIPEP